MKEERKIINLETLTDGVPYMVMCENGKFYHVSLKEYKKYQKKFFKYKFHKGLGFKKRQRLIEATRESVLQEIAGSLKNEVVILYDNFYISVDDIEVVLKRRIIDREDRNNLIHSALCKVRSYHSNGKPYFRDVQKPMEDFSDFPDSWKVG